ncbi:MAG: GNAT family N-acetyltransferase [Crocinitomicaceae bacterium]|nr:GNAT family N-acetyltransferase [Crocinitomicaceae bacterium]
MELKELLTKEEMLASFDILTEVYPNLTQEEYSNELDTMLQGNYGQVVVMDGNKIAGLSGYWIGSKLWCGKYLEADNVVVSKNYRGNGIASQIFSYLEEKGKKEECTLLALDSYSDNFEAHKFFYSTGYVPRGFHFINILDKTKIR